MNSDAFSIYAAVFASLVAAIWDARTGRIPNWLTLPLIPLALLAAGISAGWVGAAGSLGGLFACTLVPGLLYRATRGRGIGGGDVKLFAALGALLGPTRGLEVEFGAFVVLSCLALVRLAYAGKLLAVLGNTARLLVGPVLPARLRPSPDPEALTEMRMGPAIAIASISSLYLAEVLEPWLS